MCVLTATQVNGAPKGRAVGVCAVCTHPACPLLAYTSPLSAFPLSVLP